MLDIYLAIGYGIVPGIFLSKREAKDSLDELGGGEIRHFQIVSKYGVPSEIKHRKTEYIS